MVFTSHIFVFYFLPLFLAVYFGLPRAWRNLWITLASYVFYGWWEPWFVCLMMFTTVLDFIWGKVITRPGATLAQQKFAVAACVVTNLLENDKAGASLRQHIPDPFVEADILHPVPLEAAELKTLRPRAHRSVRHPSGPSGCCAEVEREDAACVVLNHDPAPSPPTASLP